ncbi:MAG: hypothetical protein M5U15_00060 [Kiritimatiellae bacterium]|nr:hypothetical protein [Kiritimatiellia bacterium]
MSWNALGHMVENSAYHTGVLHGASVLWHEEGPLMSISTYENGHLSGLYREWYANGGRRAQVQYFEGHREGRSYVWNDQGNLIEDAEWRNGNPWNGRIVGIKRVGHLPVIDLYSNGVLQGHSE